jgi:signal peptidase I
MRTVLDWLLTIAAAVAVVLVFEAEVAKPYRVPSASMEPTLHCARPADGCEARFSDRVIACEVCYRFGSPHREQIVVFHSPPKAATHCAPGGGGTFVKRLIGLPGDTVHEDENGFIWIDGSRLAEPYVAADARRSDSHRDQTWQVPPGHYFFLGDNRSGSCDSRIWGSVPRSNLIGPVLVRYWPPTRVGFDLP